VLEAVDVEKPRLECDGRNPVPLERVPLRSIDRISDRRNENSLERIDDRIQIEIGHFLGDREAQFYPYSTSGLLDWIVHAVLNPNSISSVFCNGGGLLPDQVGQAFNGRVGTEPRAK